VDSLQKFISRVKEVSKGCDLTKKFAWNPDDLINSQYPTPEGVSQIWLLELFMDNDCPKYTQLLSSFSKVSSTIFVQAINSVKELPAVSAFQLLFSVY